MAPRTLSHNHLQEVGSQCLRDPIFVRCINIVRPRAVPVITSLCRTARIAEVVNRMVKWDEDKPGYRPAF